MKYKMNTSGMHIYKTHICNTKTKKTSNDGSMMEQQHSELELEQDDQTSWRRHWNRCVGQRCSPRYGWYHRVPRGSIGPWPHHHRGFRIAIFGRQCGCLLRRIWIRIWDRPTKRKKVLSVLLWKKKFSSRNQCEKMFLASRFWKVGLPPMANGSSRIFQNEVLFLCWSWSLKHRLKSEVKLKIVLGTFLKLSKIISMNCILFLCWKHCKYFIGVHTNFTWKISNFPSLFFYTQKPIIHTPITGQPKKPWKHTCELKRNTQKFHGTTSLII